MEGTGTSLWLFLLLNQLLFCSAQPYLSTAKAQGSSSAPVVTTISHTTYSDTDTNNTRADCLIDTEMGLIAIGSAGGLIVCLLVATMVLACQVCHIHRRVNAPRTSRSNMDLVSSAGYWGSDRPEVQGLVGPCDASVMLEEVRTDKMEEERQAEIQEAREEAGAGLQEAATTMAFDLEGTAYEMKSSSSRDYCLEVPKDLEDMPLVV